LAAEARAVRGIAVCPGTSVDAHNWPTYLTQNTITIHYVPWYAPSRRLESAKSEYPCAVCYSRAIKRVSQNFEGRAAWWIKLPLVTGCLVFGKSKEGKGVITK